MRYRKTNKRLFKKLEVPLENVVNTTFPTIHLKKVCTFIISCILIYTQIFSFSIYSKHDLCLTNKNTYLYMQFLIYVILISGQLAW